MQPGIPETASHKSVGLPARTMCAQSERLLFFKLALNYILKLPLPPSSVQI